MSEMACPYVDAELKAQEQEERERYVKAALEYLGTPYHHMGMIKGAGVDCATLLICAARDANLQGGDCVLGYYPPEWHLHRNSQRYLAIIANYCKEVPGPPRVGDIVLWQFGRSFSHGAIVIEWPKIIHAYTGQPVRLDDALKNQTLTTIGEDHNIGKPRPMKIFSHWSR